MSKRTKSKRYDHKRVFYFSVTSLSDITNVLRSHKLLKQNSNGIINTRLVAGGNGMDRNIYGKEVRSSPTVHVENMLIQIGYDTISRIKMCSMDVEGAFLEQRRCQRDQEDGRSVVREQKKYP